MRLIVGLGNPGKEYEWTRHNLGFLLIDKLAQEAAINVGRRECQALVGKGSIEGCDVKLAKPQTFMNLSGEAVSCLVARHKIHEPADRLIIISDDLALPLGRIRIRARGSAGGHNGLKSIIQALGTNEFVRLRIGIQPEHPVENSKRYVLAPFNREERRAVDEILDQAVAAIRTILRDGVLKAMTENN